MEWIGTALNLVAAFIDACTGAVVVAGLSAAALHSARSRLRREMRLEDSLAVVRLLLGRWLVLALELALAADILRSIVAPTWDDIGKLAAIAALRTVLNHFLEKEIEGGAMGFARHAA